MPCSAGGGFSGDTHRPNRRPASIPPPSGWGDRVPCAGPGLALCPDTRAPAMPQAASHHRALWVHRAGLPIGIQFIGRPFDEARLLQVAYAYEAVSLPRPQAGSGRCKIAVAHHSGAYTPAEPQCVHQASSYQ
jgi:hypothetical protein